MHRPRTYLRVVLLALILPVACDGGTGPGEDADNLIGPEGGTFTSGALTLEVPAGALDEPVEVTATAITDVAAAAPADFLVVDGTGFDLRPEGLTFNEPATLSIRIADTPLPAGVSLSELRLLHLDGSGITLPSEVDPDREVVAGTVEHFSSFGVGLATRFSREACPDLALGGTGGMPLEPVALGRLPDDFEPPLLVVATAADDTIRSYGVVEMDDAGDATMIVPIHPSADPAGGEVRLYVSDGTRACAGVDFTIASLPDASGEMDAVVDLLQDVVRAQAAELGATTDDLLDTPVDSLPPALIPLALTQSVIDHPENDHSLRAIADGTSSEAADARLDLLEPLLALTGLRSALEGVVAAAEAGIAADVGDPAADPAPGATAASVTTGLCTPEYADNAQFLDYCMDKAASAAFRGPADEVLDDLSTAMTYGGLVPGLGTATAVGGAVIWVVQTEDKRNAALLPSLLTRMELEAKPTGFLEDEDGPGSWTAAVYATNQGYDLGKEFLEGALQGAGVAGVADKAQIAGPEVGDLTGWVLTGPVAEKLLEGGTIEEFMIEAENYGPVYVDDDAWSESRIVGDAFSISTHGEYEPEQPGTATLSVRTEDGEFGGQQVAAQAELEVKQIQMTASPDEVYLSADEPQTFSFKVIDSKHPEMVEVSDPGSLQGTVGAVSYIGDGLHTVKYTAPSNPDPAQPDLLTVEHTATTGARAGSTERRLAIATIRFGDVEITPRAPCVDNADVQTFTADIEGLGSTTIRWEIESGGGSLSSTTGASVEYTAPSDGSGTVTLRAYVEDHPDNDDRVTFTYGTCTGLAVYRVVAASIEFPFSAGGTCSNPDLDESVENDNTPEGGLDPLVPPAQSAALIDRTETVRHDLDASGSFGGDTDGGCVYASFQSRSGYDATYTGSATADSIDIDVQTYGESECKDMGSELGVRCSGAVAAVGTTVRFDLEIDQATSYDFDLQLTCDAYVLPTSPEPSIDITTVRVEPDGTYLPPNATTEPMSVACGGGNTVTLDHVYEFADPAEVGQTDRVMIVVQFTNGSFGALEGISEEPHDGYTQGYITLKNQ